MLKLHHPFPISFLDYRIGTGNGESIAMKGADELL
jgi:hypothetical protein